MPVQWRRYSQRSMSGLTAVKRRTETEKESSMARVDNSVPTGPAYACTAIEGIAALSTVACVDDRNLQPLCGSQQRQLSGVTPVR